MFDKAIGDRSILQPSSLRMEAYGSSTISILGKFHACSWDGRTEFTSNCSVTSANASPNLLSRDSCYMLGVLKPCYSVETSKRSSIQTPKQAEKQQRYYDQPWKWQGAAANFHQTFSLKGPTQRSTIEKRGYPWNLYRRIHRNWEISWPSI